jgi:uncharacterized protein YkuJ
MNICKDVCIFKKKLRIFVEDSSKNPKMKEINFEEESEKVKSVNFVEKFD